jgi:hypothetical protein
MTLKEFIDGTIEMDIRPRVKCADGFLVSIQASSINYSQPRTTGCSYEDYASFELGFPSENDELIAGLAGDDSSVYPYVSKDIVEELLHKHGGIVGIEPIPEYFPY